MASNGQTYATDIRITIYLRKLVYKKYTTVCPAVLGMLLQNMQ